MNAPAAEKEVAFRVAEAVRHIEIGLTSLTVLILGVAFILYGVAIELSRVYPRWLGWLTVVCVLRLQGILPVGYNNQPGSGLCSAGLGIGPGGAHVA